MRALKILRDAIMWPVVIVLFALGWSACKAWDFVTGAREVPRG